MYVKITSNLDTSQFYKLSTRKLIMCNQAHELRQKGKCKLSKLNCNFLVGSSKSPIWVVAKKNMKGQGSSAVVFSTFWCDSLPLKEAL